MKAITWNGRLQDTHKETLIQKNFIEFLEDRNLKDFSNVARLICRIWFHKKITNETFVLYPIENQAFTPTSFYISFILPVPLNALAS